MDLLTVDFDYELPDRLIAQTPSPQREGSRLLVVNRPTGALTHDSFSRIGAYLRAGDVLVANRSRVIPARLAARKPSGGAVEVLLLRRCDSHSWTSLLRPSRRIRPGISLAIESSPLRARVQEARGDGEWLLQFGGADDVEGELRRVGRLALPPYIKDGSAPAERYQTVYADREGSVAAPTAGLHFSEELLAGLRTQGITIAFITLHIGVGTFRPVTALRVDDHQMHAEWGEITPEAASTINRARSGGGRVVAVGTTATRLLESAARDGTVRPFSGDTSLFLRPGSRFQAVDALITNFHLPRSTLLMLVSAFAGRDLILSAYREAVRHEYRFFSFGDAMLIV